MLEQFSKETIFLAENKIVTYDDFKKFKHSNEDEWCKLRQDKENLQKRFRRATNENKKTVLHEKIKELHNYKKYCDSIEKRSDIIEGNINEFHNSDLDKEKDKVR